MSFTGMEIADRAWIKVLEATGGTATRWTEPEVLKWFNDGQRAIVARLPSAKTVRATPTLAPGQARQDFAGLGIADGIVPIDVTSNYTAGGARGSVITKSNREWFDCVLRDWMNTAGDEVENWFYDERDPKAFYIYPQPQSGKVELVYGATPADLADLDDPADLDDIWQEPLLWWVLFSFFTKNATYAKGPGAAQAFYALFQDFLAARGANVSGNDKVGTQRATGSAA